jgi:Cu/Ag efflux pump CusA
MASPFVFGGIFTNGLSSAVAALVGFTGLMGSAGRYGAILVKRNEPKVERATAIGFFGGLAIGCIALLVESVL